MIDWIKSLLILLLLSSTVCAQSPQQDLTIRIIDHLDKGNYRTISKYMDKKTRKLLKPITLRKIWEELEKNFGNYQKHDEPQLSENEGALSTETILHFEQNGLILKLNFEGELLNGMWVSPFEYAPPEEVRNMSFGKEQLTVHSDTFDLPAEVIIPRGCNKCPMLVLVHGSGPNDMDESIGPNKVFKDLALLLASRGIATLRYDKRSKIYPDVFESGTEFSIYDETVNDALAALELARTLPYIDSSRVYVLGHSLGAYAAPLIANADRELAGTILLAGPDRPIYELLPEQYRFLLALDGKLQRKEKKMIRKIDQAAARLREASGDEKITLKTEVGYWPPSFFQQLAEYRPSGMMDTLPGRFLVLQGEMDYQVSYERDFLPMRNRVSAQQIGRIRFQSFKNTDHLMMDCGESSEPSDYYRPRHVRSEVIDAIKEFID